MALRNRFGTAYLQTVGAAPDRESRWASNQFLPKGAQRGMLFANVEEGESPLQVSQRNLLTEEQVFGQQQQFLNSLGLSLEELNTPILKPNGKPFMQGSQGKKKVPMVLGDILVGTTEIGTSADDRELARDAQRSVVQAKQSGQPLTRFVLDKFDGPVDRLVGANAAGQRVLINQQTNRGDQFLDVANIAIPALALGGITGLTALGPSGAGVLGGTAPSAPTGLTTSVVGPAAGGGVPAAVKTAASTTGLGELTRQVGERVTGGGVPSFLSALTSPTALQVGGQIASGLIGASQARAAGREAARGAERAADVTAQVQRDILNQAQAEQLRQEQLQAPFREAALSALPQLQQLAGQGPDQINIDPNLLANLPNVPNFGGPDLTNLQAAIEQMGQAPSTELSPQAQAAIDIGTRLAERQAAASGFRGSGNLLAELQQLGTEQASLDFLRQQALDQERMRNQVSALQNLATLESGTEQEQIRSAQLQRELARQSAMDPIELQMLSREMQRQDIDDQFARSQNVVNLAPGTPNILAGNLPVAGQVGAQGARFFGDAGSAQAAGQFGSANTIANMVNNIGRVFGRNQQNQILADLIRGDRMQPPQVAQPLPPGPSPSLLPFDQPITTGFQAPQTGANLLGSEIQKSFGGFQPVPGTLNPDPTTIIPDRRFTLST